jgi:PBSX family phage terminase large subunit
MEFTPHSEKQERAIWTQKRILLLGAGTQFGKTVIGAVRMKIANHTYTDPDDNFIITSPTYKTMMQSTLPYYLKLMNGIGTYNSKLECFKIFNGGTVYFRTETDPDSIVGITNVRHIWCDEAGKYRKYFWENIQNRADFRGCGIDLTTSPYALNWIVKELIKPTIKGTRDDVEYIQAASWENPFHSLADPIARAHKRATMDVRRFDASYGGEFGQMIGLVYDCFDSDANQIDPFELPTGTRYFAGVDWGWTDPFVIKVRAITPENRHYGVAEFYRSGMTTKAQKEAARSLMQRYPIERFYCDPSQPGSIKEFQLPDEFGPGLPATAADNAIHEGISDHYNLLKTGQLKYFRSYNPYTLDEYETYHYPEPKDLRPDQDSQKQDPVDQNNHALDSERYVSRATYRRSTAGIKNEIKIPEQQAKQPLTNAQREASLKKRVRANRTEKWST